MCVGMHTTCAGDKWSERSILHNVEDGLGKEEPRTKTVRHVRKLGQQSRWEIM